jgi:hypothetical protein
MGTQRSRLFIAMLGSEESSVSDRVRLVYDDGLNLNLKPELRKYGDAKGQQLETETIISEGAELPLLVEG